MSKPIWTDNHCHLTIETAAQEIEKAKNNGVERLINIGTDIQSSKNAIQVAQKYEGVWATVGIHPHDAKDYNTEDAMAEFEALLGEEKVVAVGECGFDFYYNHSDSKVQDEIFRKQVRLAHKHNLPLVIHTREAWTETFEVLDTEGVPDSTIFHCFTGGTDEVEEITKRGGYISFSGVVTFKNAIEVQEAAKVCSPEVVLVETDAPFLSPEPYRGAENSPANVVFVGKKLSELMGIDFGELAQKTWDNTSRAFRI